jgi:StbA protein.
MNNENRLENKEIKMNNAGSHIVVCDLGNYNVKAINEDGKQISFKSNVSRDYESYPDGFQYVLLDGEYTYFERGSFTLEYIKTNKNYTAQLLYSISRLYEDEDMLEINLSLLLPIGEMEHKQKYIDDLKGKEFEFTVKTARSKQEKFIKINDVMVIPEGFASYFTINENIKTGTVMVADLGGRTCNVTAFENGVPKVLNTYRIGILNFYMKLQKLNEDKEYTLEDVEKGIKKGDIKVTKKLLGAFMQDILNEIKINVNLNQYDTVIWTGGGSKVLEEIINEVLPKHCTLHENPLYSNILGALEASKIAFNKVEKVGA